MLSSWPGLWVCDLAKTGSSLWKAGEAVLDIMFFLFFFPGGRSGINLNKNRFEEISNKKIINSHDGNHHSFNVIKAAC